MTKTRTAVYVALAACLLGVFSSYQRQSYAQSYPGDQPGQSGSIGVANSTLTQCANLGIERNECNEGAVLLKERVLEANAHPINGGSGTPMLATQVGQLGLFVGVLGAVFGGVAAAFFISGKRSRGQIPA